MNPFRYVTLTMIICAAVSGFTCAVSYRNGYEDGSHAIECTYKGPYELTQPPKLETEAM